VIAGVNPYIPTMFFNSISSLDNPFKAVAELCRMRSRALRRWNEADSKGWMGKLKLLMGLDRSQDVLVPIRTLSAWHKRTIAIHLKSLDPQDRYMRFGYAASDDQIDRYVASIDFKRDDVFGIFNRRLQLIAMAHLARSEDEQHRACAEFGVSVLAKARGRGYGGRLFDRAVMHSRNHGVQVLYIHALSENTAMLKIARKAGAKVERDGSESNAWLILPPGDVDGFVSEMLDEQLAQTDYWLKAQGADFLNWVHRMQEYRFGISQKNDKDKDSNS
jgi:RimJ/RimL family protein N-acetyltransferase